MSALQETTQRVFQSLQLLYAPATAAEDRSKANNWLGQFQGTVDSWSIVDRLLQDSLLPVEVQMFAAQTLRKKIRFDLEQLPLEALPSLRDAVLNLLISRANSDSRGFITQLCLAAADLAVQLTESQWPNVVAHVKSLLLPSHVPVLLEFLTVLPEECANTRSPIEYPDGTTRMDQLIGGSCEDTLSFLWNCMQQYSDVSVHERVLTCVQSWLRCISLPVEVFANSPLFGVIFDALIQPKLFDVAVDAVCDLISKSRDSNVALIRFIGSRVISLEPQLQKSLRDDDEDSVRGFCRIVVEAGESYLPLIIQEPEKLGSIVRNILICTSFHDLDIAKITFGFWYQLADMLDQDRALAPPFFDVYRNLVDIMIRHLQYPPDLGAWSADERDEFREFRHTMGDCLKDCCTVIGARETLARPYEVLKRLVAAIASNENVSWQSIEAPIFSLRAMGANVDEGEDAVLPEIMRFLPQLPTHSKIRYAAILVIGRYSDWTLRHPEFIPFQMDYICAGFQDSEAMAASALALKYLCRSCASLLITSLPQIKVLYDKVLTELPHEDVLEVTEAAASVLNALPADNLLVPLQEFYAPIVAALNDLISHSSAQGAGNGRKICCQLERITLLVKYVYPHDDASSLECHPCFTVIQNLWPLFQQILSIFAADSFVCEHLCRLWRYCVSSLRRHFAPLLPQLLNILEQGFSQLRYSCFLWATRACVREFLCDEEFALLFLNVLNSYSGSVFPLLSTSDGFTSKPDGTSLGVAFHFVVVEDFFKLCYSFVSYKPAIILNSQLVLPIIECAIAGLNVDHSGALDGLLTFLRSLSDEYQRAKQTGDQNLSHSILRLFQIHSVRLAAQLLQGVAVSLPPDYFQDAAVLLTMVYEADAQTLMNVLQSFIAQLPSSAFTTAEKEGFKVRFTGSISSLEPHSLRQVLSQLASSCRRRLCKPADDDK